MIDPATLAWDKGDGLLPAVVQHADTGAVLMLGYMDRDALDRTRALGRVTFYSRSRGRLWTKGETSGNALVLVDVTADCDRDTLLVRARPQGPTCHTGAETCFGAPRAGFLDVLDALVAERAGAAPDTSYTARLLAGGVRGIAQKVGEEGVETALAAVAQGDAALLDEAADLVYHLVVLLRARGLSWSRVVEVLAQRHGVVRSPSSGSPG